MKKGDKKRERKFVRVVNKPGAALCCGQNPSTTAGKYDEIDLSLEMRQYRCEYGYVLKRLHSADLLSGSWFVYILTVCMVAHPIEKCKKNFNFWQ